MRGADQAPIPTSVQLHFARLQQGEEDLIRDMTALTEGHPAMHWLGDVKGVGPVLAAKLIGLIDNIESFTTCSKLWRFAGYAPTESDCRTCMVKGKGPTGLWSPAGAKPGTPKTTCPTCLGSLRALQRERPQSGERLHYNVKLKTVVYLVAGSFLKVRTSPYRPMYDGARAHYETTRPYWTPAHRHMAAMRRVSKLFLSHLWQTWREAEGLPVRPPYAIEYLKHSTFADPWAFTDAKKAEKRAKEREKRSAS
jgi:hypothetical protein